MLNEQDIPADLLPQARTWFARQMTQLEEAHGRKWPEHRAWLADYLNAELREHLAAQEAHHGL